MVMRLAFLILWGSRGMGLSILILEKVFASKDERKLE